MAKKCPQIPTRAYAEPCSTGQKRGQKKRRICQKVAEAPFFFSKNEPKWPKSVLESLREHMQREKNVLLAETSDLHPAEKGKKSADLGWGVWKDAPDPHPIWEVASVFLAVVLRQQ